jgi:DNA-binding NtrC family response regulator
MLPRATGKKIVIVDDDAGINSALREWFKQYNQVETFLTAEQALEALTVSHSPDVMLLDYILPGMNGLELFTQLKARFPDAKFILITGYLTPEMAEQGVTEGFDALVVKPFDLAILEKNIVDLVGA